MKGPHRQWYWNNIFNFNVQSVCQFHIQGQNISSSVALPSMFSLHTEWKYTKIWSNNFCYWRACQSNAQVQVASDSSKQHNRALLSLHLVQRSLAALTLDDRQVAFMAQGPGITPSGIPIGREAEPVAQMWRPLTRQFRPFCGLYLPAPAFCTVIGWLQFPILQFGASNSLQWKVQLTL